MEEFTSKVLQGHQEDAVEVPFDPQREWLMEPAKIRAGRNGWQVTAEMNGVNFQTAIVKRSRKFWMLVKPEILIAAGVKSGDEVTVRLMPLTRG